MLRLRRNSARDSNLALTFPAAIAAIQRRDDQVRPGTWLSRREYQSESALGAGHRRRCCLFHLAEGVESSRCSGCRGNMDRVVCSFCCDSFLCAVHAPVRFQRRSWTECSGRYSAIQRSDLVRGWQPEIVGVQGDRWRR